MKYCRNCLQPDTRPNSAFTDEGLCPACEYHRQTRGIDWEERHEILFELVKGIKRRPGTHFDCIVGVSGGKDSTRQATFIRDKLELRPLLVSLSHPPQQLSKLGADNISNLISLGFDVVISSPAPETWRRLMRESFFRFTNWARSTELALFSSVPQLAIRYGIPLIFWGENPALQVGDLKTLGRNGYDGNNLRYSNTLSSGHDWMRKLGLSTSEIIPYVYPAAEEFEDAGIQIVFLGWFLQDFYLLRNGAYAASVGLNIRTQSPAEIGDLYGISNLDEDWHNMNQMIKYLKFGFGKVTEYVNEQLRSGEMDRETAIGLCERYDGKVSEEYIDSFCSYIDIDVETFWSQVKSAMNKDLFALSHNGDIVPRFRVGEGL